MSKLYKYYNHDDLWMILLIVPVVIVWVLGLIFYL